TCHRSSGRSALQASCRLHWHPARVAAMSGDAPVAESVESTSRRVRRQLAAAVGPLSAACTTLVEHPRLREVWPEYLVLQHQIIRATVSLTEAALERSRALPHTDGLR